MKLALLGAVGALAVASAAQAAPDATTVNGYVDADYSHMSVSASGLGDAGVDVWGGKAAVAFPIGAQWGAQIDGAVNDFRISDGGGDQTVVSPTGHLFYRNDQWLGGAFVGAEIAPHISLVGGGVEGQYYPTDNVTVDGGVAYGGIDKGGDVNLWGVRLGAKDLITDNLSLGASVNYVNLGVSGETADLWTENLNGEWQLKSVPLALTLGYEHGNLSKINVSSDSVLVGVRWTFGGSLRDRERHGASLPSLTQTFGGEAGQALLGIVSAAYGYVF